MHLRHGSLVRSSRSFTSASSFARVIVIVRCLGPVASAVMNGRLMSVELVDDSSHLACGGEEEGEEEQG
jgi:hypothetical protein